MRALRAPVLLVGLVLYVCTVVHSDARENNIYKDEKTWFRRIMGVMRKVENGVGDGSAQSNSKNSRKLETETGEPILEIFPRDLRRKKATEISPRDLQRKIISHLTGPLYFSPKCRKHVYRLYHNTRDCTVPAYYKRCARLLTRLAESSRCQEG